MKIVSWNINGYRSIVGQTPSRKYDKVTKENKLFTYLDQESPDIICLQETKSHENQIDEDKKQYKSYTFCFSECTAKKGYSGVAIISKVKPNEVNYNLGVEEFDSEGRVIEAHYDGFILFNIYFPSGTSGYHRVEYKLKFYDALFSRIDKLKSEGRKIIICGDYNTAHNEIDLARPKQNVKTSGFLPEERAKLDSMVDNGYIDTFRALNKGPNHYTWWSQRGSARANNVGWRIDYHFVSDNLMPQVTNSYIQPNVEGSDHCPLVLELGV